jgi:hypothetical protein
VNSRTEGISPADPRSPRPRSIPLGSASDSEATNSSQQTSSNKVRGN